MFSDFLINTCKVYKRTSENKNGLSSSIDTLICESKCRFGSASQKDLRLIANIKDVPVNVSKIYLPAGVELEENYVIVSGSSTWKVIYPYHVFGVSHEHHVKALISKIS